MPELINNERFRKLLLSVPAKAIELLYDAYYYQLLRISENLTRHHDASVDIVQETFIQVWEKNQELGQHHEQSIQHYLVRVVRNKSISFFKSTLKIEDGLRQLKRTGSGDREGSIEVRIIEQEILLEARQLIATFPRRERECLLMKIDNEMTTAQISDALHVSAKAVERSLTSANRRLRQCWAEKHRPR
jgi:RNA polymerase sigma factor (sigma-70 family)